MSNVVYPIALELSGKRCLVVGGGVIADGKLDALLAAGARITLVSPGALPRIAACAADGQIDWRCRPYEPADLDGAFLVIAATDDRAVNAQVAAEARARGILVNAVDDIPNCDFFAVAIVRRGDLQLAISTNGRSPAFARWLRERLDREIPAEYGDLLAVLGDVRDRLKERGPIPAYEAWRDAIDDAPLAALRAGDREAASERLMRRLDATPVAAGAAAIPAEGEPR
ncbi:MAG TPA: bifunctional precorrin-2 dehydrogenase/sirohydrochlorin ferrochelatase [Thermomicrobiales bacterium]|jgi:precorrin-2 dehydrogenase/sirohydrochlorin ferrochelatase|nr:bifunctional precorrin-2 dehydrogenase/sirohydrochlorin ferrochelatase [Thermomicrobiales bacterium]